MTNVTQAALLCGLIERSIIRGELNPHQLTELFELVRQNPPQYAQVLKNLSTAAKANFRLYCCLQGKYLGDCRSPADQLPEAEARLGEIVTLLNILGEHNASSDT